MQSEINIRNVAEVCYIDIDGTIGVPEEWQFDDPSSRVTTYEKFRDTVAKIADIATPNIVVNIRSTGGDVNDALLIHDALKALDAHIVTRCYGYAASAATIIAQAASEGCRQISANALYLIHNSICATEGNAATLESKADLLHKTDIRLAELYAARSARSVESIVELMNENGGDGRWLSPEETLEMGLADEIIGDAEEKKTKSHVVLASVASGVSRLWSALGFADKKSEEKPSDRNVLHFEEPKASAIASQSIISFQEGQRAAAPTKTKSVEDPSICGDVKHTLNEAAYAADVRSFSRF